MHNCRFSSLTLFFALASIVDRERERERKKRLYSIFPLILLTFFLLSSLSLSALLQSQVFGEGVRVKKRRPSVQLLFFFFFILFFFSRLIAGRTDGAGIVLVAAPSPAIGQRYLRNFFFYYLTLYIRRRERETFSFTR